MLFVIFRKSEIPPSTCSMTSVQRMVPMTTMSNISTRTENKAAVGSVHPNHMKAVPYEGNGCTN